MTEAERLDIIVAIIAAVRPAVQQDGGDLELVAMDGPRVRVRVSGRPACYPPAIGGL